MSKRYKRQKRHEYHPPHTSKDSHHLLWMRRRWSNGALVALRKYPYCIIDIPRNTLHREIHENIATIPTPSAINAQSALNQLRTLEKYGAISDQDDIVRRLEVLIALFDCAEPRTTDALKRQLAIAREFYGLP